MLSTRFVRRFATVYNERYPRRDQDEEKALLEWLGRLPEPKYLDLEHFVRLGRWKTSRQTKAYRSNVEEVVVEATKLAYELSSEPLKLHVLRVLRGVDVAVASTILYFMFPRRFPIFDVRARTSLKKAGVWDRGENDATLAAWREYVPLMRRLSQQLRVTLRELDKALYAYDRWGNGESEAHVQLATAEITDIERLQSLLDSGQAC